MVGESGAGKSTIGNAVIGLLEPPGEVTVGEVHLDGERIDNLPPEVMRKIRGKRIGMIFQDPDVAEPLADSGTATGRNHPDPSRSQ